eukprot:gb/GFBE01060031.1/.p1 GENE.gb/GFBE01060031.1/~~gb/GFBE01060031.1/.p1  ORF type:complete len:422 (+),score=31.15 gb/GFBE01060031.1/:1-1266(+)
MDTMCKCETGDDTFRPIEIVALNDRTDDDFFPCGKPPEELPPDDEDVQQSPSCPREGLVSFIVDANLPLNEPPLKSGYVWYLVQGANDDNRLEKVFLSIHTNGLSIRHNGERQPSTCVAWSPFSLVQACRLHTVQADNSQPLLRLFKVSVFHHGLTHFFALYGDNCDRERARWVADVSRALRMLTQSLFPPYQLATCSLPGAAWTSTRLLAGYMLLYDDVGVSTVYGELHAQQDSAAGFAAYEDDSCTVQVVHISIDTNTCVSERIGVDCSCFGLGNHHFSTRSCAEKMLWLRAISNVKVKLRHWAEAPTPLELRHYRSAVRDQINSLPPPSESDKVGKGPLLPRRRGGTASPPLSGPAQPRPLPLLSPGVGLSAAASAMEPLKPSLASADRPLDGMLPNSADDGALPVMTSGPQSPSVLA